MAKGQTAVLIIVLVVIGAVIYFAWPFLQNLPSNPVGPGISTNNNIITIGSYSVSSLKMFPDELTTVSFLVQNNGDHEVLTGSINFYDLGGMNFISLSCDEYVGGTLVVYQPPKYLTPPACSFDLKPFQSKKIILILQAPKIGSLTTFKISYLINYPYSQTKSAVIPIIDGTTRTKPLGKFSESQPSYSPDTLTPSYGPLQLSYKPPVGGTTNVNNQIINEYWGVNGQPFRLELQLSHVGTVDGAQPVRLSKIDLTLPSNLVKSSDASNTFCPIEGIVNKRLDTENDPNFIGPRRISAISSGEPLTLNCQFTP